MRKSATTARSAANHTYS